VRPIFFWVEAKHKKISCKSICQLNVNINNNFDMPGSNKKRSVFFSRCHPRSNGEYFKFGLPKEAFDYRPIQECGDFIIPDDSSQLEVL
jgi:hypothetical protein